MVRLATDPHYFASPIVPSSRTFVAYYPITVQAQVGWAVQKGIGAAGEFIQKQIGAGALDGGIARCKGDNPQGQGLPSAHRFPTVITARLISTLSGPRSRPDNLSSTLSRELGRLSPRSRLS